MRLAERQHGIFHQRQVISIGLSPAAIRYRVSAGRLHRVHDGVYALVPGALRVTRRQVRDEPRRLSETVTSLVTARLTQRRAAG